MSEISAKPAIDELAQGLVTKIVNSENNLETTADVRESPDKH